VAKYKKSLTNANLYRQFSNNASEMFDYTMTNIMDGFYDGAMNSAIDGKFKAVCLSGIKSEDTKGGGTDANDAVVSGEFINLIVRPLTDFGNIMPDPRSSKDPNEINGMISLHSSTFLARSDYAFDVMKGISFGQIIDCYFEKGSISNSDFRTLRFSEPKGVLIETSFQALATVTGVQSIVDADWASASMLGNSGATGGAQSSAAQDAFEKKLGDALKAQNLPFHVTDRSRTVDDQMNRILNKYNNNSPEEVVSTYGASRGAAMVKAIRENNTAKFRELASKSSKHLKGNAIDIRSWHYTDSQIPIVLGVIRKLGGNPLLENIVGCWTKSGRDVTATNRLPGTKAGGRGKGTPCHNEHIHIDIPEV
jgi:hypothetical protein